MNPKLTGNMLVKMASQAFDDVDGLFRPKRDKIAVRRHALKLRFWPEKMTDLSGTLVDLDWSWILSTPGDKIGELRIHDEIGGHNNLRILFFLGPPPTEPGEMRIIWVLSVFQKKRDEISPAQVKIAAARRILILREFTGGPDLKTPQSLQTRNDTDGHRPTLHGRSPDPGRGDPCRLPGEPRRGPIRRP